MATYLPEVEVGSRSLDFICRHTEMWGVERKAYPRIAPRGGAGATMWKNLGSYSLAALAMMRAGCCEGAEPLLAVVPGLWCGILRDKLRALGPMPDEAAFDDYAETMTCLEERGVRVPERWHGPTDEARRDAMRAFLQNAWRRGDIAPP
jgi:hypothetical protein